MSDQKKKEISCSCGCAPYGLGGFIAVLMSWSVNHSIVWAFVHGALSWLYVIFWLFAHYDWGDIPW